MTINYLRNAISDETTPQTAPLFGRQQVKNNAGGFTFAVDDWKRLERFIVLGTEAGTYYVAEQPLTRENAEAVLRCIAADGPRTVETARAISVAGRAPKNDPALFVLALALTFGDDTTKQAARRALISTADAEGAARIGTHILHLAGLTRGLRGRGPCRRRRSITRSITGSPRAGRTSATRPIPTRHCG